MRNLIGITDKSVVVCDNKECDYETQYEINQLIHFINKPCPKCGQNLLTVDDYIVHERMIKIVNWINKWLSWITLFQSKKGRVEKTVSVHYHDGVTTSKIEQ